MTRLQNLGRDSALTHLLALHRAEMHMWLALHAHRQVHPQQYTLIIQHIEETCRILRRWIHGTSVKTAESKGPPQQVRTARKAKGKTASVRAVAAATRKPKAAKAVPTTPKRPRSKFVTLNSFVVSNLRLPPRVRSVSRGWISSRTQGRERRHTHAEIVSPDRITSEYVRFHRASFLLNSPSPLRHGHPSRRVHRPRYPQVRTIASCKTSLRTSFYWST